MWKLISVFGFLSVAYATPVYQTGITKNHFRLVSIQFSSIVDQVQREWLSQGKELNERVDTTYGRLVRNNYQKLHGEIESVMRNSTNYMVSRIIPFVNQSEKSRDLLQCIDLRKTINVTDEVIEKVLLNVHKCKWNVIVPILYDFAFIKLMGSAANLNITLLEEESLQCSEDISSANYTEILQCIYKVKQKVLQMKKENKIYLNNLETLLNEKLTTDLRLINECNTHLNFDEVRKVQDEQFDRIEKCMSDHQKQSADIKTGNQNEISSKDLYGVLNDVIMVHFKKREEREYRMLRADNMETVAPLPDNMISEESLRVMEFIEKKWQANGHENKALSTYLTPVQYSDLMECTTEGATCSDGTVIMAYYFSGILQDIAVDLIGSQNVYNFAATNALSKACIGNIENVSNFNDAIQCILRVDGQTTIEYTNLLTERIRGVDVLEDRLINHLGSVDNCIPLSSPLSNMANVKKCFSERHKTIAKVIF